jgi:hypothetical protein
VVACWAATGDATGEAAGLGAARRAGSGDAAAALEGVAEPEGAAPRVDAAGAAAGLEDGFGGLLHAVAAARSASDTPVDSARPRECRLGMSADYPGNACASGPTVNQTGVRIA